LAENEPVAALRGQRACLARSRVRASWQILQRPSATTSGDVEPDDPSGGTSLPGACMLVVPQAVMDLWNRQYDQKTKRTFSHGRRRSRARLGVETRPTHRLRHIGDVCLGCSRSLPRGWLRFHHDPGATWAPGSRGRCRRAASGARCHPQARCAPLHPGCR
jgi:hypothetical protein